MSEIYSENLIAVYKPQQVKQYQNNKLIEALPLLMDYKDIAKALEQKPSFSDDERDLPTYLREASMSRIFGYFQPLKLHINYASKIGRMIRDGYISRRITHKKEYMSENDMRKYMNSVDEQDIFDCVLSAGVIGMSGMGKTKTTEKVLKLYPQLIVHERPYNCTQVVWIKIDCPSRGSIKHLCLSFFKALDNVLDTNYERQYFNMTSDQLLSKMASVADAHYLGLLVIDEIQHLAEAKGLGKDDVLNFLVTMNNVVKVPVLLIGTPRARELMTKDFRQARRMDGIGGVDWARIPNDRAWEFFVKGFWRLNWLQKKQPLTQELVDTFYEESQGIVDVVLKIYVAAHLRAMLNKTEEITPADIRYVSAHDIPHMKKIIEAIKIDPEMAENEYGDITASTMDAIYLNVKRSVNVDELDIKIEPHNCNPKIGKALAILSTLGIPDDYADKLVLEAIRNKPEAEIKQLVDEIYDTYVKLSRPSKEVHIKADRPELLDYLKESDKGDKTVYNAMRADKLVISAMEDFDMGMID